MFDEYLGGAEWTLFYQALQEYDWERLLREVEPVFRDRAAEFHRTPRGGSRCPRGKGKAAPQPEPNPELQELLFDLQPVEQETPIQGRLSNAGRRGNRFVSYVKAFLLAPLLHIGENCAAIRDALATNPGFRIACGFDKVPSQRTLADVDQIMKECGIWELIEQGAYRANVEAGIIDEKAEEAVLVDNTHLLAWSTPSKCIKECRECPHFKECEEKVSTDRTADWYVKSKCKIFYAHMIGVAQLAKSGAPVACVVLSGRCWEPDTLEPLCLWIKENYPNLQLRFVVADGIFNCEPCRRIAKRILGAELIANVNPGKRKDKESPARGIKEVTKYGVPICEAGHEMVFMGRDMARRAYLMGCPVFNEEARAKLERLGVDVSDLTCDCKEACSPNSASGRTWRMPREMASALYWEKPQLGFAHKALYKLRTKIERLFGFAKVRLKMVQLFTRGVAAVLGHVRKFMAVIHMVANIRGAYGF
jgi:hypothetical protein